MTVALPDDLHRAVRNEAARRGLTISDWTREAMEAHLSHQPCPGPYRAAADRTDSASLACAEQLGVTAVATTDRRHFAAVRPRHTAAFDLLP